MNKVLIVDTSESDRRLMSGLLVKSGYADCCWENGGSKWRCGIIALALSAKRREKLPPGAVIGAAMKFVRGTAQKLINWQKTEW